jgi:A/G-specific adenine glycosylase
LNYKLKLDYFPKEAFQEDLIHWFQQEKRDLPWRENRDPYRIWVSEIMLQQTKVDTVIPYFNNFMEKFPTPEALAQAPEQEVLKAWEGLGYYSRARNLQSAVREVVEQYNGQVPDTPEELGKLKGIGPYTKGAILSIAFQKPYAAVDGNVMRVFSRVLKIEEDIAKTKTKKIFEQIAQEMVSKKDPSSFNQGLMELGALVCKPKNPECLLCPVQEYCLAFKDGVEQFLPIKTNKKAQKVESYAVLLIRDENNRILVQQRPKKGLLANLWEFPMVPLHDVNLDDVPNWVYKNYGLQIDVKEEITQVKHVFSHLTWELTVYSTKLKKGDLKHVQAKFVSKEQLAELPFPVSHQKILTKV